MNRNLNDLPDGKPVSPRKLSPLRRSLTIDQADGMMDEGAWPPPWWESEPELPSQSPSDPMSQSDSSQKESSQPEEIEIEDFPSLEELTAEVYCDLLDQASSSPEGSSPTPSIPASLLKAMLNL